MEEINWGIIGLGNIAEKFIEGFKNVENAKLKAMILILFILLFHIPCIMKKF